MSQPPPPPPIPGVKPPEPVKTTDNATQQLACLQAEIARCKEEIDRLKIEVQLWESDATTHARDNFNLRLENAYLSNRLAKLQQ